jgi:hypothetical protein
VTTGGNNNVIGHAAGDAVTTSSDNNLMGYVAGTEQ